MRTTALVPVLLAVAAFLAAPAVMRARVLVPVLFAALLLVPGSMAEGQRGGGGAGGTVRPIPRHS